MLSHFSRVRLFVTLWAVAHQAPLAMGFSRNTGPLQYCHALLQGIFSSRHQTHISYVSCIGRPLGPSGKPKINYTPIKIKKKKSEAHNARSPLHHSSLLSPSLLHQSSPCPPNLCPPPVPTSCATGDLEAADRKCVTFVTM